MKKKQNSYSVSFKVEVHTSIDISASSFEEALTKAKEYDVKDIVDFNTEYIDGKIKVSSVWEND